MVLRPVSSHDAMTADWTQLPCELHARISTRITNDVPGVNRVVLDVTSKPPGTPFGALLVGYFERGRLLPCGSVSGGYDAEAYAALGDRLAQLAVADCPLEPPPVITAPVLWVAPELVIRIGEGPTAADRHEARVAVFREDHSQQPFCSHLLNARDISNSGTLLRVIKATLRD